MYSLFKSLQTLIFAWRSSIRGIRGGGNEESQRCFILELPTELLYEIASHLPPISEASLALTCKRFYGVSRAALHADELKFQRDFTPFTQHAIAMSFENCRWQFLEMLEDRRWVACSKCLKLHPRSAFSPEELNREPDSRFCRLGQLAGVVDLCPCKKLTFQGTLELVELLRAREHLAALPACIVGNRPQERYLWHSCTERYGSTALKINIFPELDNAGRLLVRTEYHLHMDSNKLGAKGYITTRFGCPHRSLDFWLTNVCQISNCQCHDLGRGCIWCAQTLTCSSCRSTLSCPKRSPFRCEHTDKAIFYFGTLRSLGKVASVTAPGQEWALQRAHPSPTFTSTHCNGLCPLRRTEEPPHWVFNDS
ncbi:hypothetical protein Egran_04732 [Elaphomyces granulatus]|uniref:F-box domain-containing protein n=1 Tax=Elaphomyces granulatus TaxID=519963 RepID=A0A232LTP6_9EURO|nr:hypothetical protein Egran_04732 [Elaphomyces granulatus]